MNRAGHNNVDFFTGTEVEHTRAYGMNTLFVVGVHPAEEIIEMVKADHLGPRRQAGYLRHIYFGANQSFPSLEITDAEGWKPWKQMIQACLDAGLWCTLDLDVAQAEGLINSGLCVGPRFIPMISVKLPHVQKLGRHATVKIDDQDFAATNPGVWCIHLNKLTQQEYYTDWDQYSKDEVLK